MPGVSTIWRGGEKPKCFYCYTKCPRFPVTRGNSVRYEHWFQTEKKMVPCLDCEVTMQEIGEGAWVTNEKGEKVAYVSPQPTVTCPMCMGLGSTVKARYKRQDPVCELCKGKGRIPKDVCEGCGRPAYVRFGGGVKYCGAVKCFETVVGPVARKWGGYYTPQMPHNMRPGPTIFTDDDEADLTEDERLEHHYRLFGESCSWMGE